MNLEVVSEKGYLVRCTDCDETFFIAEEEDIDDITMEEILTDDWDEALLMEELMYEEGDEFYENEEIYDMFEEDIVEEIIELKEFLILYSEEEDWDNYKKVAEAYRIMLKSFDYIQ